MTGLIPRGSAREVFRAFLALGCTSFGGPVAHLGYFHVEFVVRRRWLESAAYGEIVALCQLLPGPASSQVGFALGLHRAGWRGALAAWAGFTLPSALLLATFALGAGHLSGPLGAGFLHGLKLAAVAIVVQAVWSMSRTLCPDRPRAAIAVAAALVLAILPGGAAQAAALAGGGAAGLALGLAGPAVAVECAAGVVSSRAGLAAFAVFTLLLTAVPALRLATGLPGVALFDACYRAGAFVFGGGHVVLPLLRAAFVPAGWLSDDAFLAGYGAAQAVPGPLFTFAAYLGMLSPPGGAAGAAIALVAIFLPGFLLLISALPFVGRLRDLAPARAALAGVNAAVVGVLLAALYDPVWTGAVGDRVDFGIALAASAMLLVGRVPPIVVVGFAAAAGVVRGTLL
ncbi:MAG: chromate efflux transporter [Gammaproteobacteria bacterium]|nr:chromate efflux transporter [Gammaproteobacteria bacterium]